MPAAIRSAKRPDLIRHLGCWRGSGRVRDLWVRSVARLASGVSVVGSSWAALGIGGCATRPDPTRDGCGFHLLGRIRHCAGAQRSNHQGGATDRPCLVQ